jgi:hypothetical protein
MQLGYNRSMHKPPRRLVIGILPLVGGVVLLVLALFFLHLAESIGDKPAAHPVAKAAQ